MSNKINSFAKILYKTSLLVAVLIVLFFSLGVAPTYAQYYNYLIYPYNGNTYNYAGNYTPLYVTTNNAANITSSSAVLSGQINGTNLYSSYNITTWFQYGTSTNLEFSTVQNPSNSGYVSYNSNVSNLIPNTIYYFRAVAQSAQGVVYGSTNSFRTNYASVPNNVNNYNYNYNTGTLTAITQPATNVSSGSVELNSLILNPALDSTTSSWFEYGAGPDMSNASTLVSIGGLPAARHVNDMDGLSSGTTYYFRAVAQNSYTKVYGSTMSFTTSGVRTNPTTNTPVINSTDTITKSNPPAANTPAKNTTGTNNVTPVDPASSLGASAIGANTFLPVSLFGWMLLLILVLILALLAKHTHAQFKNK